MPAFDLALLALLVEAALGYPDALYRAAGHPVTWIGRLIAALDRGLNRETASFAARRAAGGAALLLLLAAALGAAAAITLAAVTLLPQLAALLVLALLASSLLAQRSLHEHVARVAEALETRGLAAGRKAVSQIVGRDPEALDEGGIGRAAIESLAENFSDGVVAPAFWLALLGLPGALAYKAINTADSMIGHKSERHLAFGWAAARLDDLVNLPASRLSALLLIGAAFIRHGAASARAAARAVARDARRHKSPNAGWPEAAVAGALGIALAGPRSYHGVFVNDGYMGDGGRTEVTARDIRAALGLYRTADALLIALVALLAAAAVIARG